MKVFRRVNWLFTVLFEDESTRILHEEYYAMNDENNDKKITAD